MRAKCSNSSKCCSTATSTVRQGKTPVLLLTAEHHSSATRHSNLLLQYDEVLVSVLRTNNAPLHQVNFIKYSACHESDTCISGNAAPATKVTLALHQLLDLRRKATLALFFLLHAAKVPFFLQRRSRQSALQSAYHDPQLDKLN